MIQANIKGIPLVFETAKTVFSPDSVDRGTLAMLSAVEFAPGDKVLDLGCGYGVVGILAAKLVGAENVVMTDIDPNAIALAEKNATLNEVASVKVILSDGFRSVSDTDFTMILSNPPYHTDFSVAKHFIHKGFNRLRIGGRMYLVTKRDPWYRNKLTSIFGGVNLREIDGYTVFEAIKRRATYARVAHER